MVLLYNPLQVRECKTHKQSIRKGYGIMAKKKTVADGGIINLTVHEAAQMINTIRAMLDMVIIVDPKEKTVWDIDENERLYAVGPCYGIWDKDKECDVCTPLKSIETGEISNTFEKKGEEVFHTFTRPVSIDGRLFAFEISHRLDDSEELQKREFLAEEQMKNQEVIKILASEYTSVYYIDLETLELTPYSMNEETETTFGSVFRSGITYSEAYELYVDKLIYPDDKAMMLEAGSVKNIKKELANKKTFLTQYRSSDNKYSEMKFVKVGDEKAKPVAVALGFAEKDDEIRREQEIETERQRNTDIIEILASEYTSVYYIDLLTDELNPYTMNEETETTFGSVFRSGITYSEAYDLYVDKLILNDDKKMMLKAGSVDNIKRELARKKTFLTRYRSADNKYSEMKFVKVGGDNEEPVAVALGFAEKDEEIRRQRAIEAERQRNTDIIEILASEYTSVYYIDLLTDELNPYTMNEETETTFGSVFRSGITYSEAYNLYVDKLILGEDKSMMLMAGSVENIKKELRHKKTFLTRYRSADNKYSEMKFVKVGGDNEEPVAVALGFAEKDEEIRRQRAIDAERQRNTDIIEILASEYTSVYYIDLETDELDPYTMNEATETEFGKIFRSGIQYSNAYRMYVDTLIYPDDKPMMLKAGSIGNIVKELRNRKTFITTYRNSDGAYCEMKFVKVGNDEGIPKAVALGFSDKDEELRAKEEESIILKRNIDIIEILASEYSSVYYIDLTTDELDPYTMNASTESQFGLIFRSGIKYTEAFKLYVDQMVYPEDREMMLRSGSIYNIVCELSTKKTFITQYRDNDGHYSEMKFVKVGDDENPEAVALGFANRDDEIRVQLARGEADARDRAVISGLSDDFGCVVYAGYDDSEIHYRFDPLFEKYIPNWASINNFTSRLDTLIHTIMHPDDREEFFQATRKDVVRENVTKDGVYYVNFRTLINDEVTYYQAKFVKDESSDDHIIAGFHNVDEATKREMDALDKAEIANKAKSTFLFSMSHDIRTPMNAIVGFTSLAQRHVNDPVMTTDFLNKIEIAGKQLLSLINQVLEMSRIESGKVVLQEHSTDLKEAVDATMVIYSEQAKIKDLNMTSDTSKIKHTAVITDADRVKQVITNIIGNALKYTPAGGSIRYTVEEKPCDMFGYGLYVFTVQDNGIGMSKEYLEHIFEEFSRETTSTVSQIQGTGLGMSIVKRMVELLDGEIHIESEKGKGTKVVISIPMRFDTQEKVAISDHASSMDSFSLNEIKILLVEDNEMNRESTCRTLSDFGVDCDVAEDGDVAVEMIKNSNPGDYDLILMDIQMPRMNGYEASKAIRALDDETLANIPIVAMTANAFEEDRRNAFEAGMDGHLAKPVDVSVMIATISGFLRKKR